MSIIYGTGRHFRTGEALPLDPVTGDYLTAAQFDAQKAALLETAKITARENARAAARAQHQATGPRSPEGKAIASRNATTHGLFARDVVLPRLGEDPAAYQALSDRLLEELAPRTLLERQYVEKIASASWRLRRHARWEAQVWEDETLTESERTAKLDAVARHETALHRQIDAAVRMLRREVCPLFHARARADALDALQLTEGDCRGASDQASTNAYEADCATARRLVEQALPDGFSPAGLDNTRPPDTVPDAGSTPEPVMPPLEHEICGNELPPLEQVPDTPPSPPTEGTGLEADPPAPAQAGNMPFTAQGFSPVTSDTRICRNEPPLETPIRAFPLGRDL